jgi:hypothetical protein
LAPNAKSNPAKTKEHRDEVSMISMSVRALVLAAVCVAPALVAAPRAQAATPFDGEWSVVVLTKTGICDPSYRFAGKILNGVVYYLGSVSANISGRVAPSGAVHLTVSVGPNHAVGSGKLTTTSGTGTWRGQGPNGQCSGSWNAEKSGS